MDLHLPVSPASFLPPSLPPSLLSQLVPSLSICLAQGLEVQEKADMEVCIPKTSQPQGSVRSMCNREMAVMKADVAGRSPETQGSQDEDGRCRWRELQAQRPDQARLACKLPTALPCERGWGVRPVWWGRLGGLSGALGPGRAGPESCDSRPGPSASLTSRAPWLLGEEVARPQLTEGGFDVGEGNEEGGAGVKFWKRFRNLLLL